jgi:hypothetical protein
VKRSTSAPRWDLPSAAIEQLLLKNKQTPGISLWSLAWARLRGDRASRWAMLFLALISATSLLAPLLPLPSPVAVSRQAVP